MLDPKPLDLKSTTLPCVGSFSDTVSSCRGLCFKPSPAFKLGQSGSLVDQLQTKNLLQDRP